MTNIYINHNSVMSEEFKEDLELHRKNVKQQRRAYNAR